MIYKDTAILLLLLLYTRLKTVFSRCEDVAKDQNTGDHLACTAGNRDLKPEVCFTHRIPRACMGTARVKQEKEADTGIIVIEKYEMRKKRTWAGRDKSQTRAN